MIHPKASPGWDWLFQDNPTILSRKITINSPQKDWLSLEKRAIMR